MALAFAKIWQRRSDTVDEFFALSRDAETNRQREYDAAAMIQKHWRRHVCLTYFRTLKTLTLRIQRVFRGYRGRKRAAKIAIQLGHERRMRFYNSMATKIQKVWRGWLSRKHRFDFYARKRYIAQMDEMRRTLQMREAEQRTAFAAQEILQTEEKLERVAATRHHLLGTRAVPGVFARVNTAAALRQPDVIDEHGHFNPAKKIPESKLRSNPGLEAWVRANVGKNPRGICIKPPETPEPAPDEASKVAQGPFLASCNGWERPKHMLLRRKLEPLHPSLRVQTDYFDTRMFAREERRKDIAMRVSQRPFMTGKTPRPIATDYFLREEPYVPKNDDVFRKYKLEGNRVSKKDFKNVLGPVRSC
ncbi:hypothetical protein HK105_206812 [Polyrhizophydium stewartii]|uniref:Spermatogenesis-associated protein 17 n=1 Tax=Polyrhizophydium stewartii TaxID=2732419 RepID=A0ABR4N2D8_9FUNG